ncbi:MAG: PilZ domain-containing protein [bacterium]|nr:PilZ domain-containing protein [bacterium]
MMQQRNKPRVYTNEMNHFEIRLSPGESVHTGYVGDISEEGVCAVIPGEESVSFEKGARLSGTIGGSYLSEEMSFEAEVAWQASGEQRGRQVRLVGLKFTKSVDLPDQVIAALMVTDE